ncbi:SusC/RagA family TonB-linked outer membrane protein [Sphingobacterium kyonggiense]
MMRTLGFFLLLFQISIAAEGQGVISLRKQQIKVSTLVQEIKKQSGFRVLYSSQVLSGDEKIAVDFENSSLETVIASLAKQLNVGFEIKDQTVLLTPIAKSNKTATNATSERQQSRISGQVKDEKGNPLRGATVVLVDKNQTVSTDEDGSFSFDAASIGSKIRVQYIGYQTQTVTVNSLSEKLQVQLTANPNVIEDVVVTALGIKRAERSLSYNVQQVGGDELTKVADANLINALNGKVAGVNINSSSAGVGAASKVVLRGAKSISKDNNVLYVIDGIPMYNRKGTEGKEFASTGTSEGIADVNPEDIESMSVLTGAAAAALYGSEAANGAIVITTKKGAVGKTTLSVSQNTQFHNAFVLPEFQNRYGTGSGIASNVNDKSWGKKLNDATFMGYDPAKDYLHTGTTLTEGVTFSTGTEKNQTYASAAAVNSKGIIPNSSYDRYNFTFRNSSKFLDDKLSFDAGLNYIIQNDQNMTNQGVYSNPLTTAYLFPRGDDWDAIRMFERYDVQRKINTQYWPQGLNEVVGQNPYWINYRNMRNTVKNRYMINASLNYKLNDWLSFTSRGRLDNIHGRFTEKLYASTNTTITDGSANGFFGNEEIQNKRIYGDVVANFNKTFDQFSIQANLGAILQQDKSYSFPIRGPILENGIPNIFNITQIDDRKKSPLIDRTQETQSMFINMELGYKNTYFLTATGRNDWASQLAGPRSVQSSFFYPSIGASIMLSEALELPEAISYLKLRSSYASVGTPFPEFLANPTYTWDVATQQYTDRTHYPISDLKPERTNSFEVGLAAKFLNGFNLDVSLYHAMTLNQTFDPKISVSSGYSTLYVQTGRVLNKGIELALGYDHTWENSLRWASNFTFSANKNRIEELVRDFTHPETGAIINKNRLDVGGLSQARFILKEGGTLGDLYSLSDIRRDDRGLIYVDEKGQISENNNVGDILIGSVLPKANMAWRNSLDYKGFNFDFMFAARLGGVVYSATQAFLDYYGVSENSALARDQGGVLINGTDYINAESYYNVVGNKSGIPQYYAYSASNVRLQEVSLGYTFPKSLLKEKGQLSVSLIGRNLLMLYKKAPFDPESTASTGNYYQGIDYFMVPNTRNLGFNVRLKF